MSDSIAAASLDAPWTTTFSGMVLSFSPLHTDTGIVPQSTALTHPDPSVVTVEHSGEQSTGVSEQYEVERRERQVPIVYPPGFYESWSKYYSKTFPRQCKRLEDLLGQKGFLKEFGSILNEIKDKLDESGPDAAKSVRQGYITGLTEVYQILKDGEFNGPPDDPQQNALLAFENRTKATNDEITDELRPPAAKPSPSGGVFNEAAIGAVALAGLAFGLQEMCFGNLREM